MSPWKPRSGRHHGHQVLLIDDDDISRRIIQRILENIYPQIGVHSFADPLEALKWVSEGQRAHLVITDFVMPHMDGIQVIRNLRQNPAFALTPIILVTSSDDPALSDRALAAGARAVFRKPIEVEQFKTACQGLLDRGINWQESIAYRLLRFLRR